MRRLMLGLVVIVFGSWITTECHAQNNNNLGLIPTDPIQFYYGYYLPRQAVQAMQPGPEATINAITADRQRDAATNRGSLYDPTSPFGFDDDPFGSGPGSAASRRGSTMIRSRTGTSSTNLHGDGAAGYYNRAATYYPTLRVGRGTNRNLAPARRAQARSGGFGMPGIGGGGMGGFGPR